MKRILHLATQAPGYRSGGELGTLQFSYALSRIADAVDYIGPPIKDDGIVDWYENVIFFDKPLSKLEKFWTALHFHFDRNYLSWKRLRIDFSQYDMIFVEFTKLDYLIRDIRKAGFQGKIVVRAHNVEQDFFKVNYEAKKTPVTFLKYVLSAKRERYMLKKADLVFAITEQDKMRLTELYPVKHEKIKICPVGVNFADERPVRNCPPDGKMKALMTGTLRFGPNADATRWFIENVYPMVSDICHLTVAGFRPNDTLKAVCAQAGIHLVDGPESMQPYFEAADMVLAPIFEGGGMKVKVAEALSYALPVVTTQHGSIGYAIENGINGYVVDSPEEFANAIGDYYNKTIAEREAFCNRVWELYRDNYSLNAIEHILLTYVSNHIL